MNSPVPSTVAGASRVDMLVMTTRKPAVDPGELFSGERGTAISLSNIVVSIPPDRNRKIGEIQWPARVPGDPETEFVTLDTRTIESYRGFTAKRAGARELDFGVYGGVAEPGIVRIGDEVQPVELSLLDATA